MSQWLTILIASSLTEDVQGELHTTTLSFSNRTPAKLQHPSGGSGESYEDRGSDCFCEYLSRHSVWDCRMVLGHESVLAIAIDDGLGVCLDWCSDCLGALRNA